ncbi:MAG: hypothetical protein WD963_00575, partial [Candidatus Paceibacterota bacterium]
ILQYTSLSPHLLQAQRCGDEFGLILQKKILRELLCPSVALREGGVNDARLDSRQSRQVRTCFSNI